MKCFSVLVLVSLFCATQCSKILIVMPTPARSHYILGNTVARTLAEAGHDITMVSSFVEKNPPKNGTYRDIQLTGFLESLEEDNKINFFELEHVNPFLNIPFMNWIGNKVTQMTFEHPKLKKLLNSGEHFDVVIVEQFYNDALKVLAYHFKAPLILFSTLGASDWINPLVGNPSPPSYIPDTYLSYTSDMTFRQRVVNLLFSITSELNHHLYFFPAQNRIMKKHFPDAPDINVLNYNASLVFVNSHESTNQAVPYVPCMINIGGFHVNPPKQLPKDLKDFMDSAKEGVIYFSMGSNLLPSQMSEKSKKIIVSTLSKLKQKVLWKWDEDTFPGKPDNVKLSKWFPQQEILAHPNTKLFITHGGLLSTTETIYHGVPVLTLPIFGDQKVNAARAQMNGFGISLSYSDITEESFTDALHNLLNDPKYRENAKRRSRLMHDRPITPKQMVVFWTEFVIRNKGASHLRVAALDLPWYKYHLLDVIAFLALVTISSIAGLSILIRKVCCGSNKKKDKVKKN
uniref:UDP-glucuronosyltransferase n=1 Tax=Xylotrechus quadripes TaxID=554073 RepID=A0A6G7SFL0_9CUCU|nr:UDP-glycosyltransferase [Xylotrechus quadripes]